MKDTATEPLLGRPVERVEDTALLSGRGQFIAGGQSLVPMLNMRLARPATLVDITRIPELSSIEAKGDQITIGAAVRQAALESWPDLADRLPLVRAAISGCSGPVLIVIGAANNGGLTKGQTAAWLLTNYVISLVMALYYKLPVTGAYSIPGAALVAGALGPFPFEQVVGAFLKAGAMVFILGIAVPLIMALPGPLIGAVAGLAMITVLLSAFQSAFDRNAGHQIGAFVTLIVAIFNVSFLNIRTPFWALVAGAAVSVLNEKATRSSATGKWRAGSTARHAPCCLGLTRDRGS
ncbi:benzoate/H(+) symporter BenE family transporter [Thalassococcus sp. BH17M4-6]|uniref:benzoate/H(+) symporter BenE family transporter n=1 Tax=Thalassococcus sp. BH17M4-6 TaxID=3413148 RepID=UPI003BDC8902